VAKPFLGKSFKNQQCIAFRDYMLNKTTTPTTEALLSKVGLRPS